MQRRECVERQQLVPIFLQTGCQIGGRAFEIGGGA